MKLMPPEQVIIKLVNREYDKIAAAYFSFPIHDNMTVEEVQMAKRLKKEYLSLAGAKDYVERWFD